MPFKLYEHVTNHDCESIVRIPSDGWYYTTGKWVPNALHQLTWKHLLTFEKLGFPSMILSRNFFPRLLTLNHVLTMSKGFDRGISREALACQGVLAWHVTKEIDCHRDKNRRSFCFRLLSLPSPPTSPPFSRKNNNNMTSFVIDFKIHQNPYRVGQNPANAF